MRALPLRNLCKLKSVERTFSHRVHLKVTWQRLPQILLIHRASRLREAVCAAVRVFLSSPSASISPGSFVARVPLLPKTEREAPKGARKGTASAEAPTSFRPGRRGPGGESSLSSGSGDSRRFGICDMSAVAGGRMFSTRLTTAASAASERERAGGCALLARFTFLLNCIRSRGKAIRGEGEGRPGCFACVGVCVP